MESSELFVFWKEKKKERKKERKKGKKNVGIGDKKVWQERKKLISVFRKKREKKNVEMKRFGLVWFNGISTIVGYLMPNPLYNMYIKYTGFGWLVFMAYQPF